MMLWKCCTQYASKYEKLSSGHRTGKCQFSFQSQRKTMAKSVQTAIQFHSSHTLAKSQNPPSQSWTVCEHELSDVQDGFRKGRGSKDQIANIRGIVEKAVSSRKHLLLLYWLCQNLWLCGSQPTVENSERDWNTRPPEFPPEKSVCRSRSNG